jgi:D-tyrosyl-tRNA(Tyr) deacylase
MKAVIQRVKNASVSVNNRVCGGIAGGLLVYLGVALEDTETDANWIVEKTVNLRIFDDADGKMNLSILDMCAHADTACGILAVSQFTLLGDAHKGRRPSWAKAAPPDKARALYELFIQKIKNQGLVCESGEFQAYMQVSYTNDGPVTILLDSRAS